MRPEEKGLWGNVARLSAVAVLAHVFIEVPVHEYGHYWVASLLGIPVYMNGDQVVWATTQVLAPFTRTLIFLSGGLCAAALLLVLFAVMRKPYRDGVLPLAVANLAYAPLDATNLGRELGLVAFGVAWAAIILVYIVRFLRETAPAFKTASRLQGSVRRGGIGRKDFAAPRG